VKTKPLIRRAFSFLFRGGATFLALGLAILHLLSPNLRIDGTVIALFALALVPWIAPLMKSIELPGGVRIELRELEEAQAKAEQAGLLEPPAEEGPARFAFEMIAEEDPNLALAGLRIEIERRLVILAESAGLPTERRSVGQLLRVLRQDQQLAPRESSVLSDMVSLLNSAVHGARVDEGAATWALDIGPRLLAGLDDRIASVDTAGR